MPDPAADDVAIRNALARYCHLNDAQDWGAWAQLFTEDCEADLTGGVFKGREALEAFVRGLNSPKGRHLITNSEISVAGDEADVMSDLLMLVPSDDGELRILCACRYYDRYRRVDGAWLIAYKRAADHIWNRNE
ncbi:nuclear transport factor 2 family protein [Candidatus Poriferisocius sp.]|uniref:nuclear transport factor 2 family protein n=1 Tax=Candidatus Poriferisocius sp. TaxID=3101276 RepID=UPI003B01B0AD